MNAIESAIAEVLPDVFSDTGIARNTGVLPGVSTDAAIPDGQRNATLASIAGAMRRKGLSAPAMSAALQVVNRERCHPPLLDREVEDIAASVGRYAAADAIAAHDPRFRVISDLELLSRPTPPQLVEGYIPANALGALVGATETWKTFLTLGLIGAIHHSGEWLGATVKRGKTALIAAEGASGMKHRVTAWKSAHRLTADTPIGLSIIEEPVNLFDVCEVDRFISEVIEPRAPLDLVAFDTLARCSVGMDENSARDMGIVIRSADRIRVAARGTVLLNHHVNAAETKERGSSALRGACDFILRTTKTDDFVTLHCDKQKDAEQFAPVKLKLVPVQDTESAIVRLAIDVLPDGGLSPAQKIAIEALWETFGHEGAITKDWEAALPGMPRRTFFRAKNVLAELGYIEVRGPRFIPRRRP